jgi:membrane-associated phospholipid phosphatase
MPRCQRCARAGSGAAGRQPGGRSRRLAACSAAEDSEPPDEYWLREPDPTRLVEGFGDAAHVALQSDSTVPDLVFGDTWAENASRAGVEPEREDSLGEGDIAPERDSDGPLCEMAAMSREALDVVWMDHANFYSLRTAAGFGLGIGLAAVLANTNLDRRFQNDFQIDFRTHESNEWSRTVRILGDGTFALPLYAASLAIGVLADEWAPTSVLGEWGGRSLRAALVGAPPMLLLQNVLGGSRPKDHPPRSRWGFWEDDNGVSGHSFMGSLPFLTAAKMSDNVLAKCVFYSASIAVAWSRVNDNHHYLSQVALGWWLGYLSASAVDQTNLRLMGAQVGVVPEGDGLQLALLWTR